MALELPNLHESLRLPLDNMLERTRFVGQKMLDDGGRLAECSTVFAKPHAAAVIICAARL